MGWNNMIKMHSINGSVLPSIVYSFCPWTQRCNTLRGSQLPYPISLFALIKIGRLLFETSCFNYSTRNLEVLVGTLKSIA